MLTTPAITLLSLPVLWGDVVSRVDLLAAPVILVVASLAGETRGQRSEVRGQRSEDGSQRSENKGQRTEEGEQRSENRERRSPEQIRTSHAKIAKGAKKYQALSFEFWVPFFLA
jgi:hypothetical protein